MLTILLAIRVFFELLEITIVPNIVFFVLGGILIIYIVISLGFTYKYRKELLEKQQQSEQVIHHVVEHKTEKVDPKLEKEQLKLEKKKAKAAVKDQKKKD